MRTFIVALAISIPSVAVAENKTYGPEKAELAKMRAKAVSFLKATQAEDGSWTTNNAPGIAGLVIAALLDSGLSPEDEVVAKGLKHLESFIHKDGGVYAQKSKHRNYETCIALLAFQKANAKAKGKYTKHIANALTFLKKLQWDKGEGLEDGDAAFGGAGYGSHERPDMSNTAFLIEALKAAGVKKDDPAMKNALKFVSRAQNLESEHNTTAAAAKINDGGIFYTPAAGGESKAGITKNGGFRSYGSMTYAGLKSFIYAGLNSKDKRVKAAFGWIQKNYTLKENPGFVRAQLGQQGLFYYYMMFSKGLAALKVDVVKDAKGTEHDWRKDLFAALKKRQRGNGSWVNPASRWYEGDPNLVTAYALMALANCQK